MCMWNLAKENMDLVESGCLVKVKPKRRQVLDSCRFYRHQIRRWIWFYQQRAYNNARQLSRQTGCPIKSKFNNYCKVVKQLVIDETK